MTESCAYVTDNSVSGVVDYSYCSAPGEVAVSGNLFCLEHFPQVAYDTVTTRPEAPA